MSVLIRPYALIAASIQKVAIIVTALLDISFNLSSKNVKVGCMLIMNVMQ